jgi:hypothetical protein
LLQVSNPTFDRKADYLPGVILGNNVDRQEINTNINSNKRANYLLGVTLGNNADKQEIATNIESDLWSVISFSARVKWQFPTYWYYF